MSSVRSGRAMRSNSRRPWLSNRHNSTFSALAENNAKFTPRPSHVAPRGCGAPPEARMLQLRHEEQRGQRRQRQAEFSAPVATIDRNHHTLVADVAAAVEGGVGVEDFAPRSADRHRDAIVAPYLGR